MTLGVIGGLGPMATAYFMQLLISMTDARCDQEHLEMIIYNIPSVPDRTEYILGKSDKNPVPKILEIGQSLTEQGAGVLAMPCMTAHYFHSQLQDGFSVPLINGIKCTAELLSRSNITKAGIFATDGTISCGLFQKEFERAGIEAVLPDKEGQAGVMKLIYEDIKANREPDMQLFERISNAVFERGAQVIILGCTELSVIKSNNDLSGRFVDAMEVLAAHTVTSCGKPLRDEYKSLITGLK
ncbi:MAG: amino acid racemase [Clostridia bacterium]|nr:amino acid racemase [Clostridia bacterium]